MKTELSHYLSIRQQKKFCAIFRPMFAKAFLGFCYYREKQVGSYQVACILLKHNICQDWETPSHQKILLVSLSFRIKVALNHFFSVCPIFKGIW